MVKMLEALNEAREDMVNHRAARQRDGKNGGIMCDTDPLALKYQQADRLADELLEDLLADARVIDDLGGIEKFEQLCELQLVPGMTDG